MPKHAVSFWGDYNASDLLHGLSFGGGIVYQSHLFNAYTAPNAPRAYPLGRFVEIPETVELDAVAAYEIDKLRFQLNVNNLADRLNYSQSFGNRAHAGAGPHLHLLGGGQPLTMLVHVPNLLTAGPGGADARRAGVGGLGGRQGDGGPAIGAGQEQSAGSGNRRPPRARPGDIILTALGRNELFTSAALALRVFPPLFNRYDTGMKFDAHIDNAIRFVKASLGSGAPIRVRTDLSATLFLTDPADYDGGELVIEDSFGPQKVKLPAGDMVLYSASSRHHVTRSDARQPLVVLLLDPKHDPRRCGARHAVRARHRDPGPAPPAGRQ